ncbi:MAG: NAD(P)-binding domain-containing protein [Bacteroidales bacterium]|nr:NAD(P)-binding domain-containing protein [Bacteroidales bacterium]
MPFVFESIKAVTRPDYKVAVLGGGSWATAIVKILSSNLKYVYWWVREPEIVEGIRTLGHNPIYLNEAQLNSKRIRISNNMKHVVKKADLIVLVIPSAFIYDSLSVLPSNAFEGKYVISATKGLLQQPRLQISLFMHRYFGVPEERLGLIMGPSHAEEIARERLTYLTSASCNPQLAEDVANLFRNRYVVTTLSNDMRGIETCVILKNIYALAAGIFRGLGAGDNLLAVFNSNCFNEMVTILQLLHPMEDRKYALSPYLGDFLVTTYSQYSRNRNFGIMVGKGYSVQTILMEMKMVAEGYSSVSSVYHFNQEQLHADLPILNTTYKILYEKAPVRTSIHRLLDQLK